MQETTCTAGEWILIMRRRLQLVLNFLLNAYQEISQVGKLGVWGKFKEGSGCQCSYFTNFYLKKVERWGPFELPLIWYWTKNRVGNQMLVHYEIAKVTKAMDKARGDKNSWHRCHFKYICHLFKPCKSSTYWGWEGVLNSDNSSDKQSKMKFHERIF